MKSRLVSVLVAAGVALVAAVLILQVLRAGGMPDPLTHGDFGARVLDIAVLVFREGLECILVLAAITAGMIGTQTQYRRPIAGGAGVALLASIATWFIAATAVDALATSIPALDIQAGTGLLAIVVLLVIMNWFFHRVYWTGWISMHNRKKRELLEFADDENSSRRRVAWGLGVLGFTSLYREGFEVVLFLQTYRLQLGGHVVLGGVLIGAALAGVVAVLTFVMRHKLPYKQMLVATGVLLGVVLLVMVGEQVQEMQLAHWIPTTTIRALENRIPGWMGLWFSIFPNVQNMLAQAVATVAVLGSYGLARWQVLRAQTTAAQS